MTKWTLIIDVERCVNCNNCVLATKDEHVGNDFPGYAAPQPKLGHSWIAMERRVRGEGSMVDSAYRPVMCNHCDNAPCVKAAKDGAIYKRPDGIVIIDPQRARGRRELVRSCPYQAIWWNDEYQVPQVWIFDAHLLDQNWTQPRCAQVCPTGAIKALKVDDQQLERMVAEQGLQVRHPEYRTRPNVYYRNQYRFTTAFIGGNVVAQVGGRAANIAGARVMLIRGGAVVAEGQTDLFGDFKLDQLEEGSGAYSVELIHPEHGTAALSITLGQSMFIGTVPLPR